MSDFTSSKIDFDADDYLNRHFMGELDEKNTALMRFHAQVYKTIHPKSLLEFGGGPTIYAIISAVQSVERIHFADYSLDCRRAIQNWVNQSPEAFSWHPYIRYALQAEGLNATDAEVFAREQLLRQSIKAITPCDATAADPLLAHKQEDYQALASNFCLEGLTDNKNHWLWMNENITRCIDKGAYYIVTCLWGVDSYIHNDVVYPSTRLEPEDLKSLYKKLNFKLLRFDKIRLREDYGYLMACGQKQ